MAGVVSVVSPLGAACRRWNSCGFRYEFSSRLSMNWGKRMVGFARPPCAMAADIVCSQESSPSSDCKLKIMKLAREKFTEEVAFRSQDKDASLAKALLYVAIEDEAFMAFNRDKDALSIMNERKEAPVSFEAHTETDDIEEFCLAGKNMSGWLDELDVIAKEVEAELVSREIGCDLVEVLEAVNAVLFKLRGFKRFPVPVDSKLSYLHTVLNSGYGSAIMLSVIYIEVCRRLGITILGSRVGEDFLIWPQTENPEELFRAGSGNNLFATINGRCVQDPKAKASDLDSSSLLRLDIATNRDIVGIALANLIRLHWKRCSRANHGLMLTSPLRPVEARNDKSSMLESLNFPLLRPQELRLAIMASERLLALQSDNWTLRRDHGMLLYYSRRFVEAVQELSICMAFAPTEEVEILEQFVEKLHLLRLFSSMETLGESRLSSSPIISM